MSGAMAILEWLSSEAPLWRSLPSGEAADAALGRRDEPQTEKAWARENDAVQNLLQASPPAPATAEAIASVGKKAFIRTYETVQHHELAAQVSDDLRLLAEAATVAYESATLERLWDAYASGKFPEELE